MKLNPKVPHSSFNFGLYTYEVIFIEKETNWFERLWGEKETKLLYTIRERGIGGVGYLGQHTLSFVLSSPEVFWDNPTDPERIITQAKIIQSSSSDNVLFSSKDL